MGDNFGGRDNMKASDDDGDESNNGTAINNKRPPSVNNRVNDEKNFFEGNNKKSNSYKELAMLLLCFVMLITAYGGIRMIKRWVKHSWQHFGNKKSDNHKNDIENTV